MPTATATMRAAWATALQSGGGAQIRQGERPTWRYQRGGIVDRRGVVQPPSGSTAVIAPGCLAAHSGLRRLAYSMIGHSAGGQFLSPGIAAFIPNDARRMVVADPSTWGFPSIDVDAPYGLRRAYSNGEAKARLRQYLTARA